MEVAGATGTDQAAVRLERQIAARLDAGSAMFGPQAPRIARCCHRMAQRFAGGGRLIALGADPAARSDARHVSVEFVHPVIVGKRALPATALTGEGGPLGPQLEAVVGADDIVIGFGLGAESATAVEVAAALVAASERGCMTIGFGKGGPDGADSHWLFEPPTADPAIGQELIETLYHVLWELVHVFFEHSGLLGDAAEGVPEPGPANFLYPFLAAGEEAELDAVLADVSASVRMKSDEVGELRAQTLREGATGLIGAAGMLRACFESGGRLLAFGNGGSATDAMDVVADFRLPTRGGGRPRPALDLTEDTAIITAVANDIGVAEIFQRQVIASGREGDVALAFSTSGGSENLIEGPAEARRRRIGTIAMIGYDGGRIAAENLADIVIISRSQHIPRIQEAQASGWSKWWTGAKSRDEHRPPEPPPGQRPG
jgi:D-sedoheptulose 7-phosphate isomerase